LVKGAEIECCTDQKCSRFIQDRLIVKTIKEDEKKRFIDLLLKDKVESNEPNIFQKLIIDVFGNYVLQKIVSMVGSYPEY